MSAIALEQPDAPLVAALDGSDATALGALFDRYGGVAYSLAQHILGDGKAAEDIVQDVFLDAWHSARGVDVQRAGIRTWLLGSVHRRCLDRLRVAKGRPADLPLPSLDAGEAVAATIESLEADDIRRALAALSVEQRRALTLAYFEGLSHVESAVVLGVPLGTVQSWTRLGLTRLSNLLLSPPTSPA